jgi:L-alanine-DL-glutamate epimerase-like enolase superfamily enzyme
MATIEKLECWMLRAPIEAPVVNAFGAMTTRPALFVRLFASDGAYGWGEVWCNFPQVGGEHRARLIESLFVPLVQKQDDTPAALRKHLESRTHVMAIQCREPGPFAQIVAAIDQAAWDLAARRAGVPLYKHLGGSNPRVRVYASGIGPDAVVDTALAKQKQGYRAFKLKVGMDAERDRRNLADMRAALGPLAAIMIDANQGWAPADAAQRIEELTPQRPHWVEEPIAADRPHAEWEALARGSKASLAAGENLFGEAEFEAAIKRRYLSFMQPDIGKWGGVTGCLDVAKKALAAGITFCPHWLAGGVGLAASMHLLAAVGGSGFAEVDANDNPLREEVFSPPVEDGGVTLPDTPGLGVEPDLERLERYRVPF